MNARLYDPVLGRMISPDNLVNGAFASQAYNRYSYANNNPLKYTDPSGNHPVLVAIAIAAVMNIAQQVMYNEGFNNFNVESLVLSMIQGAISAGIAGGIGDLIKPLTGFTKLAAGIGLHGLSGGLQSAVFGGNVWQGAISGAVGHLVGEALNSGASKLLGRSTDDLGLLGYFVTGGGTSAAVAYATGGDPMQAFIIGGATAAFNSFMHDKGHTKAAQKRALRKEIDAVHRGGEESVTQTKDFARDAVIDETIKSTAEVVKNRSAYGAPLSKTILRTKLGVNLAVSTKGLKWVGMAAKTAKFGFSAYGAYEIYDNYINNKYDNNMIWLVADTGMWAVGTFGGPVGTGASVIYSIGKEYYGVGVK
jgi:hypothetical protein